MAELSALFITAFLAASLLPFGSEAALIALHTNTDITATTLLLVATAGNVLGSILNWWLGGEVLRFQHRRWFPVSPDALARATAQYQRYGWISLCFAWLPIVGDPLTFVAGMLRVKLWLFIPLVTLGKAARYGALLWIV